MSSPKEVDVHGNTIESRGASTRSSNSVHNAPASNGSGMESSSIGGHGGPQHHQRPEHSSRSGNRFGDGAGRDFNSHPSPTLQSLPGADDTRVVAMQASGESGWDRGEDAASRGGGWGAAPLSNSGWSGAGEAASGLVGGGGSSASTSMAAQGHTRGSDPAAYNRPSDDHAARPSAQLRYGSDDYRRPSRGGYQGGRDSQPGFVHQNGGRYPEYPSPSYREPNYTNDQPSRRRYEQGYDQYSDNRRPYQQHQPMMDHSRSFNDQHRGRGFVGYPQQRQQRSDIHRGYNRGDGDFGHDNAPPLRGGYPRNDDGGAYHGRGGYRGLQEPSRFEQGGRVPEVNDARSSRDAANIDRRDNVRSFSTQNTHHGSNNDTSGSNYDRDRSTGNDHVVGTGRPCYNCNEIGHDKRDCPHILCRKCSKRGHTEQDCHIDQYRPQVEQQACLKCGGRGHFATDCREPNTTSVNDDDAVCQKCGGEGHNARECISRSLRCKSCGEDGHVAKMCKRYPFVNQQAATGSSAYGRAGSFNQNQITDSGYNNAQSEQVQRRDPLDGVDTSDRPSQWASSSRRYEVNESHFQNGGTLPADLSLEQELYSEDNHVRSGINFDAVVNINVRVRGQDCPPPVEDYHAAGIHPTVVRNLEQHMGYRKLTPIQKYSIPIILADRDFVASAQTGSGKTAAFLIPTISRLFNMPRAELAPAKHGIACPLVLILAPTRELATQIFDEARRITYQTYIRPCVVYGGGATFDQAQQLHRGCHILVATTGKLKHFLGSREVSLAQLKYLIVDEVDRMFDMSFQRDIEQIANDFDMPDSSARRTIMLSATLPHHVRQLVLKHVASNKVLVAVGRVGSTTTNITQRVLLVTDHEKRRKLVEILNAEEFSGKRTLIFVDTKREADSLDNYLYGLKFPVTSIHGDRSQREREDALFAFKRGTKGILVATGVAERGWDIKEVAHVILYDMSKSIEEYVHRIGRTARAGNVGVATSFFNFNRHDGIIGDLVKLLLESKQEVPDFFRGYITGQPLTFEDDFEEIDNAFEEMEGNNGGSSTERQVAHGENQHATALENPRYGGNRDNNAGHVSMD